MVRHRGIVTFLGKPIELQTKMMWRRRAICKHLRAIRTISDSWHILKHRFGTTQAVLALSHT
jgi:hypothetical protein